MRPASLCILARAARFPAPATASATMTSNFSTTTSEKEPKTSPRTSNLTSVLMDPEKRKLALEAARVARLKHADFKKSLKESTVDPITALTQALEDKKGVGKVRVKQFLSALPGCGPKSVEKALTELKIDESRRIAGLGKNQKDLLVEFLKSRTK